MFGLFGKSKARKERMEMAVTFGAALNQGIEDLPEYYSDNLKELVRKRGQQRLEEFLASELDNFHALRFSIGVSALLFGELGCVILDPEPIDDPTELRGRPGISGELLDRIVDIHATGKHMKWVDLGPEPTRDEIYDASVFNYHAEAVVSKSWNAVRFMIGDTTEPDWYRPFVEAMYAWSENNYREDLGMELLLEKEFGFMGPLTYSTFLNLVQNGFPDPYSEWMSSFRDAEDDEGI